MQEMTSLERIRNLLERKPVDRAAFRESIWGETMARWRAEGHLGETEDPFDHFNMELLSAGWLKSQAHFETPDETLEEDEETRLVRNGNGAVLRYWKNKSGTPEHVDFKVTDRASWEEHIKPFMTPERGRVDFKVYRETRRKAAENDLFFAWEGVNVFEQMHPICGHEHMLVGMALDPDWIRCMARQLSDLTIGMWELLFAEEGLPDGIFFCEDMGFKEKPFMSPDMYREIILPEHRRTIQWAHQRGLRVIMHSCGFIEPLLPGMIEAGIDMLQAMEVKAGVDMPRLNRLYGDRIGFFGGIDIREIASNDRARIDAELDRKIGPLIASGTPYMLSSDHSTPPDVDYASFVHFRDQGLARARYPGAAQ